MGMLADQSDCKRRCLQKYDVGHVHTAVEKEV